MFTYESDLFEVTENEEIFNELCNKLKHHPFESPWRMCFEDLAEEEENISYEVREINLSEDETHPSHSSLSSEKRHSNTPSAIEENSLEIDEIKLSDLKESLLTVQENSTVETIRDIEVLHSISLSQVPKLCIMLSSVFLNDTAVTLFLKSILTFEMPLSLSIASALVKCLIYPQVFEKKGKHNTSRNLLVAVLNFTEIYPKAMIDEVIVPCMKTEALETLQVETLLKMMKSNLPSECVTYCIKNILEQKLPVENALSFLPSLIERKVHLEHQLHKNLAWKVENWATTYSKNVKFTKLLISILTAYGNELEEQLITIYQNIISSNETIMKKAAENVLKKIKAYRSCI